MPVNLAHVGVRFAHKFVPGACNAQEGGLVYFLDPKVHKMQIGMGVCEIPSGIEFRGALVLPATPISALRENCPGQFSCQD